jgi:hypothetical protein
MLDGMLESHHVRSMFSAARVQPMYPSDRPARPTMRTYLICYDIAAPERQALAGAIMELGEAWARPLDSTWYVQSSERADAIEQRLHPFAHAADGLLIQEVGARALLLNTALRWFRRRRPAGGEAAAIPLAA